MLQQYQLLSWDTDVFGFPVAKIMPERLSTEVLQHNLNELRSQHIRLVYWVSDSQDPASQQAAQQANGILADRKVTYLCQLNKLKSVPEIDSEIESYPTTDPDIDLLELAYLAGLYSRFRVDSHITDAQFKKVYGLWMTNSAHRRIAQEVLVIKKQHKAVAMITLGEKNQRGDIGLLAVDPLFHGQQLGTKLVRAAQAWCIQKGFEWGQVVTQQTNLPACALYEKCGYHIEKIEKFYHFWLG